MTDWQYFYGNRSPHPLKPIADRPPWREFMSGDRFTTEKVFEGKSWQDLSEERWTALRDENRQDSRSCERGRSFRIRQEEGQEEGQSRYSDIVRAVNSALNLRRPLLVTGTPGSGKTSLAYAIAYELGLGPVLQWPVTARSKLQDALYRYDAIARLQDAQFDKSELELEVLLAKAENRTVDRAKFDKLKQGRDLGTYIQLGAVGTAFLPSHLPRVLLLDEIDKSDLTLPNDLLNLFEEGQFEIDELVRQKDDRAVEVRTADDGLPAQVVNGRITCYEFPLIVMTSNGERDFPPAFLRRCLRVEMPSPRGPELDAIVRAHFDPEGRTETWDAISAQVSKAIAKFSQRLESNRKTADLATDQLLNLVYMAQQSQRSTTETTTEEERTKELDRLLDELSKILLKSLTQADGK